MHSSSISNLLPLFFISKLLTPGTPINQVVSRENEWNLPHFSSPAEMLRQCERHITNVSKKCLIFRSSTKQFLHFTTCSNKLENIKKHKKTFSCEHSRSFPPKYILARKTIKGRYFKKLTIFKYLGNFWIQIISIRHLVSHSTPLSQSLPFRSVPLRSPNRMNRICCSFSPCFCMI